QRLLQLEVLRAAEFGQFGYRLRVQRLKVKLPARFLAGLDQSLVLGRGTLAIGEVIGQIGFAGCQSPEQIALGRLVDHHRARCPWPEWSGRWGCSSGPS